MERTPDQATEALPATGVPAGAGPTGENPGNVAAGPGQHELTGIDNLEAKQYKTLGIRVDNDLHARLSFISQLRESSLQGEIVQAIRDRVEAAQQDEELVEKAAAVREQIEAEAKARQAAIAGMFGAIAVEGEVAAPAKAVRRSGRSLGRETT